MYQLAITGRSLSPTVSIIRQEIAVTNWMPRAFRCGPGATFFRCARDRGHSFAERDPGCSSDSFLEATAAKTRRDDGRSRTARPESVRFRPLDPSKAVRDRRLVGMEPSREPPPNVAGIEALVEGEAEGLTRKAVEMALGGDTTALRLCLERLVPPRKDRPVAIALPKLMAVEDLPGVTSAVLEAVANGGMTPSEGEAVSRLVEAHRRTVETANLEQRLAALEAKAER